MCFLFAYINNYSPYISTVHQVLLERALHRFGRIFTELLTDFTVHVKFYSMYISDREDPFICAS